MKTLNTKIYWLMGQPGAGKTTLAKKLYEHLIYEDIYRVIHIDGDDIRKIFNNQDYSETGRRKNIQRAQDVALFMCNKGYNVVVSLITPYKDQREELKKVADVVEIYLHTELDRGKNNYHVIEFEPPTDDFIDIDTTSGENETFSELLNKIKNYEKGKNT